MPRFRIVVGLLGAFVGGIVFILACGDTVSVTDAAVDAVLPQICPSCEKPITADRIYYVRDRESAITGAPSVVFSRASCSSTKDVIIGGGCWVYSPRATGSIDVHGNRHKLIASGPEPKAPMGTFPDSSTTYACIYDNEVNDPEGEVIVVATAICLDIQAQ